MNIKKFGNTEIGLQAWRTKILNSFLTITAFLGLLAILPNVVKIFYHPEQWRDTIVFIILELGVIVVSVWRGLKYHLRVASILLIGIILATINMFYEGLTGRGAAFFVLLPIFALIFIGKRAGIIITALSVLSATLFAIMSSLGWLIPPFIVVQTSPWIGLSTMILFLGVEMSLLTLFYSFQERLIVKERGMQIELVDAQTMLRVQNANLEQKVDERTVELQQRNNILTAIYKITDAASSARDMHEFFTQIHHIVGEMMYAENFFIVLYDEASGMLNVPYFVDQVDEPFTPQPLKDFRGISGYIIRSGNSLKHGLEQYKALLASKEVELVGIANEDFIGVPLKIEDKIIGSVLVQSYIKGIRYTDKDDEVLIYVAQHIATSLTRFRALEAERQRTTELAIINSVQSGLAAELDFQGIIDLVGDKLREAFATPNLIINRYDEDTNLIHYSYIYENGERLTLEPQPPYPGGINDRLIRREVGYILYGGKKDLNAPLIPGTIPCKLGIAVPVISSDRILGAIQLENFEHENGYGESDLRLLTTIAASLGAALENVQLANQKNEATKALRESEEVFRKIVHHLPQAVLIWDLNMKCTYASPSIFPLIGYTPQEMLNLKMDDYLTPQSKAAVVRAFHESISQEKTEGTDPSFNLKLDLEEYCKDGSLVILESTYAFLRDTNGKPVGILGLKADITERKKMEAQRDEAVAALRSSEERYRLITENSDDVIWTTDTEYHLTYVSPSIRKLRGLEPEEALQETISETMTPESLDTLLKAYEQSSFEINQGKDSSTRLEIEQYRQDGSTVWVEISRRTMRDQVGNLTGFVGMSRDISARKHAERALRESERRLADIINFLPLATMVVDNEGKITGWNRMMEQLTGVKSADMIGKGNYEYALPFYHVRRPILLDLVDNPDEQPGQSYKHIKRDGSILTAETSYINLGGKDRVLVGYASLLVGTDGLKIGAIESIRDITELKQAEETLSNERNLLRTLINTIPFPIYAMDIHRRKTLTNQADLKFLGKSSEEEVLGKTDTELEVGVKEGEYVADITPVLADGQAFINQDERLLDADGNWIYNSASAVPLRDSNGNITGLVGISRDVTELKRAEADLKEAKEAAEAANRSKSAFLANMSHEIRTPMNAILGFSQLMLRDPYLSPSQSEHLEVINRSGEHLLALINDILELSKIEAGRLTFTPSTFDLHKLLDDMEMMFRVRTDDKRLSLIMERIGSVPHWVISDEGKLRQVLINLMGNAVKFTEEGGVGVRVGVQADESGKNRLLFEVEDTGPGIPEEEIENLFIVFEQGSSGVKMGGTGLGLALSKGFIQIMGGTISVASTAGKGSIFEFTIPFEEGKEEQVEQKRVHKRVIGVKPGQDERRVLIADDRETNRRLLAKMLAMDGFKLREVTNGAEVLAAFHEWKPDIILMDMTMPVMDGYTATRTIKATEEGKDTLIIAITASAFQEDKQRVMEAGADGYLSKPFKEAELFEIIHQKNGIVFLYDEHAEKDQETHVENDAQWQAAIAELPADLVRACRDAAENADILWLVDLFNDISIYNPAVAQKLNELASRYAYEEITYLLRLGE